MSISIYRTSDAWWAGTADAVAKVDTAAATTKPVQKLVGLLPDDLKWKLFFSGQAKNIKYLHDGDVVQASIGADDGKIDLGTQRNRVRYS